MLLIGGLPNHNTPQHRTVLSELLSGSGKHDVTLTDDMGILNAANLAAFDILANYTNRVQPSEEQVSALLAAIEEGKGFIGIHAAAKTFLNGPWPTALGPAAATLLSSASYFQMLGGWPVLQDPIKEFTVRIVDTEHPVTRGVEDFQIEDELFVLEGDMTKWRVLARAESHPIIYSKTFGKGRVHHNALGHDGRSLKNPFFEKLVLQAIDWVEPN